MSGTFSIGGLASGLDTKSIIAQLMSVEAQPLTKLQHDQATLKQKNSDFQSVNTQLSALKSAAFDLTLDLNMRAKSANSSDSTIATATAGPSAATGSYQVRVDRMATASSMTSAQGIAQPADGTWTLAQLNITAGDFTIQYSDTSGGSPVTRQATVTVDPSQTLNDVAASIGAATGGAVTANFAGNKLTLTADANTADVVAGGSGDTTNFASAMNLRTSTYSLAAGVTGGTLTSSAGVHSTDVSSALDTAVSTFTSGSLQSTTTGTFTINGTTINYDTGKDSINDVISAINSSSAKVVAAYNSQTDRITLTSRTTGSGTISLADTSGTFLQTMGLVGGDLGGQTVLNGQNAQMTLKNADGSTVQVESTTNAFSNLIPSVTFTAVKQDASFQSITVAADSSAVLGKVKAFVSTYNTVVDTLTNATAKGATNAFDNDLRGIQDRLKSMFSNQLMNLTGSPRSMVDLGITASSTDRVHLSVDEATFTAALNSNPDRVADIFKMTSSSGTTTTQLGIAGQVNQYLEDLGSDTGVFKTRDNSTSDQSRRYDDQIQKYTERMTQIQDTYTKQFTAMEQAVSTLKNQSAAFTAQLGSLG